MRIFIKCSLSALGILFALMLNSICYSGTASYLYDDIGRLRTVDDGSGHYANYGYDEVGNLLSINSSTSNPVPPTVQSIQPDVFFVGKKTPISITGQNFITIREIASDNPFLSFKILSISDTQIRAEANVSAQAVSGPTALSLSTLYGSASIQASITTSKLTFGPEQLTLNPGSSADITASILPRPGKPITLQIANSDPTVVTAPQTVIITPEGTSSFRITAQKVGIANVGSAGESSVIRVASDTFQPLAGETLLCNVRPVSVFVDSPAANTNAGSQPVSTMFETSAAGGMSQSSAVSVAMSQQAETTSFMSVPISAAISATTDNSNIVSLPVSIVLEPGGSDTLISMLPVSVVMDLADATTNQSSQISVSIDAMPEGSLVTSNPVSAKISPP